MVLCERDDGGNKRRRQKGKEERRVARCNALKEEACVCAFASSRRETQRGLVLFFTQTTRRSHLAFDGLALNEIDWQNHTSSIRFSLFFFFSSLLRFERREKKGGS